MVSQMDANALRSAILAIAVCLVASAGYAHPGGRASDGCHYCRSNCEKWNLEKDERHCHNGSSGSSTSDAPAPQPVACERGSGETWRGLVVAPECRCTPYDRDDYPYPQSVEPLIAQRDGMTSKYSGTRFRSLKESDIEHVVSLSEAHDSGLCAASAAVRSAFRPRPRQPGACDAALEPPPEERPRRRRVAAATEPMLVRADHHCRPPGVPADHRSRSRSLADAARVEAEGLGGLSGRPARPGPRYTRIPPQ